LSFELGLDTDGHRERTRVNEQRTRKKNVGELATRNPQLTGTRGNLLNMKLFNRAKKKKEKAGPHTEAISKALLIFPDTSTVMHAEQILKEENYDIRVVSPPPEYRTGCDLCIEFPMLEAPNITSLLKKIGLAPIDVLPVSVNGTKALRLCRTTDYGKYLMVRAANMKITIDKDTKLIVNVSGGGCPDVPYLAWQMVGKKLSDAPEPNMIGFSLCAYSLNMAYDEMMRLAGDK
jgi:hypothetical protein